MDVMSNRTTGRYQRTTAGGEEVSAFIPDALPPDNPPIALDADFIDRLRVAEESVARLDLASHMVPSIDWFLYAFVRKEAVVSSQIEGTEATLVDLLAFEAQDRATPTPDVEEVTNYLAAIAYARAQLADPHGLPLSMRLLNETHRRLMAGARGAAKSPGEVRRSQNWIGGSRPGNAVFVPPPPQMLADLLGAFETYLHEENSLPALVRAGLLHVQFESIHPYLDGNGRVGRLLVTLLLEHWGLLRQPLLYLSLYFKQHRAEYYQRVGAVRTAGDWEGWLRYFLEGVARTAEEGTVSARSLFSIVAEDRSRVHAATNMSVSGARLFELLPKHPIVTVASTMRLLGTTKPTASRAVDLLVSAGVLVESTGRKRDRSYAYRRYIDRLAEGTELPRGAAR